MYNLQPLTLINPTVGADHLDRHGLNRRNSIVGYRLLGTSVGGKLVPNLSAGWIGATWGLRKP